MAKAEDGVGLLLLGKPKKGGGSYDEDEDGAVSAANAALKAIKSGDAEAFSEALKLHYEICAAEHESEMEDYEEE